MSPEKQRVVIAEFCGWKKVPVNPDRWMSPGSTWSESKGVENGYFVPDIMGEGELPDYTNDLNAMHDAEKLLTIELASKYDAALMNIALYSECGSYPALSCGWHFQASQRAKAMVRALGKWDKE